MRSTVILTGTVIKFKRIDIMVMIRSPECILMVIVVIDQEYYVKRCFGSYANCLVMDHGVCITDEWNIGI